MERRRSSKKWIWWVVIAVLVVGGAVVAANRDWIYDYYRGVTYQPSAEMERIRGELNLTDKGVFLFNASQPVLSEREEFNANCRDGVTETAVLGCYDGESIYVYNIDSEELDGIRELTTAHELLHVAWARMDDGARQVLETALNEVLVEHQTALGEELDIYDDNEKKEELYVRAGTEIADLPEALERHYAEIFREQDKVVAYYDKYIGVFNRLQAELDALALELESISNEVEQKTSQYELLAGQLNADIVSFNSCADVAGCFQTEEDFNGQRAELVARQESLEALYNEINGLIETYNAKVEIYNADVLHSEHLNTLINSNIKPENIE